MGACWPIYCCMSRMASSACPGTTPVSWWRTAVKATQTLMTTPHHKVCCLGFDLNRHLCDHLQSSVTLLWGLCCKSHNSQHIFPVYISGKKNKKTFSRPTCFLNISLLGESFLSFLCKTSDLLTWKSIPNIIKHGDCSWLIAMSTQKISVKLH